LKGTHPEARQSKSSVDEIRARFDRDVERFSNLETGQSATVDAPLAMDLITEAAGVSTPSATRLLDVGCGAGNYSLRQLQRLPGLSVTLIDLSRPMLQRAQERLAATGCQQCTAIQGDIREIELGEGTFDIILAAAVLHHLRSDAEWQAVFAKFYRALSPGGSLWIFDMVAGASPAVHDLLWRSYGEYLKGFKDESYRDHVFAYIEKEDTPRPLAYQLDLLRQVGFRGIDVLHKNVCFAAFGGVK
jgi:tRNA (cmo5U34)-methyltransferase